MSCLGFVVSRVCLSRVCLSRVGYGTPITIDSTLAVLVINFTRILAGPGGRGVVLYESDISKPCLYLV